MPTIDGLALTSLFGAIVTGDDIVRRQVGLMVVLVVLLAGAVLVALVDEESRPASDKIADALRANGVPCEVAASAAKFGKQIRYAERRGIPFVWFTNTEGGHEVKDIRSGEQVAADPSTWTPPDSDLRPRVVSTSSTGDGSGHPDTKEQDL